MGRPACGPRSVEVTRNAASWGVDFERAEREGLLRIVCRYPEVMGLEDHLLQMKRDILAFQPKRVAIDSMSAFERVSTPKSFREFVIALTSTIKHLEITGLFTNTTSMISGASFSILSCCLTRPRSAFSSRLPTASAA